ncbi:glutamate mutase L [bacterium]|nr:glutamate mutase L [bacterium]
MAEAILAVDCGSTTTKAILFNKNGGWHLVARGEAPTTVEAPFDNVMIGLFNAVRELEELTGRGILEGERFIIPSLNGKGVDLFLATSSAGGGLQMLVMGVVKTMTAESAQRAALGAGAIVVDCIALDDGREDFQRIQRIRDIRPDIILLAGGTDGGTITHVVQLAEILSAAEPRARLGNLPIPVIYAGNKDAREEVKRILGEKFSVIITENIRPRLEVENLGPAREAIHELFLQHVMRQAPGYNLLMEATTHPIMSTPNAVGEMVQLLGREINGNVLAVDIGGATTDVFSVFSGIYNRTVSANLGMSYSICNVMVEATIPNIQRWIPFDVSPEEIRNSLRNKMIRPTTIPQTLRDLYIEQAVAREALRLALEHHKSLARSLVGVQRERTVGDLFSQTTGGETIINMNKVEMIIGSGGVLSHAPHRAQAALMMMDAFQAGGITFLAVDSIFMMPHLGVLSSVMPEAAEEIFWRDCVVPLGSLVAPIGAIREGEPAIHLKSRNYDLEINFGEVRILPLPDEEEFSLKPAKGLDLGEGKGKEVVRRLKGGLLGIIVDCRGRPLQIPQQDDKRREWLRATYKALSLPLPGEER